MSHFLWVEDFGGTTPRDTTVNVFGEILQHQDIPDTPKEVKELLTKQGVFVERSFLGGLYFIRNQLFQIDYIILDIRLDVKSKSKDENKWLPKILQDFYGYEPNDDKTVDENSHSVANDKLFKVAGYQLYVELVMEHGFPKDHILFCSDHANEQEEHRNAFKKAKIEFPRLYSKDDKDEVQAWVSEHRENPYSKLRRGIINGCQYVQSLLKDKKEAAIQFDEFMKADNERTITVPDMQDYLETLQNILPLRQPNNPQRFYKLFIRSLAHEWDAAYPDHLPKCHQDDKDCFQAHRVKSTFGWIMKHARNWTVHTTELDQLAEPEVAFLFMVAMRVMFNLSEFTEFYESMLLNLFDKTDSDLMKDEIGTTPMNTKLPLSRTYLEVKNHIFQSEAGDALYFNIMLNNLINNQVEFDYVTGLFQMFWHGLSPARLFEQGSKIDNKQNVVLKYSFRFFRLNYYGNQENGFLFELARSIYKRSFAEF